MKTGTLLSSLWLGGCLFLSGCALEESGLKTDLYEVDTDQTEFYKEGPAQAFGPDFSLSKGQKVTMLKRAFGYSQVMLADKTPGYVATDTLKAILPPPPPPKPRNRVASNRRSKTPRSSNVTPVAGDPLFDLTDLPAPPLPER